MAPAVDAVSRLPPKGELRHQLRSATNPRILDEYLNPVQRQQQTTANRLRVLLHECIEVGNERLVEALLCRNADVNGSTQKTQPPLVSAARQGNSSLVDMLLRWHADIGSVDSSGKTPLICAALNGKKDAARLLLDRHADIEAKDKEHRTALLWAASSDTVDVLQMLLDRGADVSVVDRSGRNAAIHAASNGNAQALVALLDRYADINTADDQKVTPVMHAASRGHIEALKILLVYGADCEAVDAVGRSALHYAAENNDPQIMEVLLQHGVNIHGRDLQNRSALLNAILSDKKPPGDKVKTVTMLIEAGIDLRKSNGESVNALRAAALRGQNDVLDVLLSHDVNVNAVDDDHGHHALLALASDPLRNPRWNEDTISKLLQANSDIHKADTERKRTALHWAAATGHTNLLLAILAYVPGEELYKYVNRTSTRDKTALHLAAQHNQAGIITILQSNQAEINCRSEGGWTPLLIAAKAGHVQVVQTLLHAAVPAEVNARTSSGMTALHWAAELGHVAVVTAILEHDGSWKNPKDIFDTTPLSRADRNGRKDIIELLRDHVFRPPSCPYAQAACDSFMASIVDFFPAQGDRFRSEVRRRPVKEVLYDRDPDPNRRNKFAITTRLDDIKKGAPEFRWIHLPANNLVWAEILITKMIVEGGPIDNSAFSAMLRIFGQQQHRGTKVHSRFMRPLCHSHGTGEESAKPLRSSRLAFTKPSMANSRSSTSSTVAEETLHVNRKMNVHEPLLAYDTPSPPQTIITPPTPSTPSRSGPGIQQAAGPHKNIGVLFMPYLHWETNSNRQQMRDVVLNVREGGRVQQHKKLDKDEFLIRGYLRHATDLHLRRTLDQFRHHNINTDKRDKDQVVYRYYLNAKGMSKRDPRIFMVDQLWIWTFDNLLLTAFPERWGQPVRDALNLFEGVIEDINSTTYPPIRSVRDLAAAITSRCAGSFDRHEWSDEDIDFMFFEIFELSIGTLTRRATALLERFEADSSAAARWLKARDNASPLPRVKSQGGIDPENEEDEWLNESEDELLSGNPEGNPNFVNRLLNISRETKLLVECKDIEDELAILHSVLDQQHDVLKTMADGLQVPKKRVGLQVRLVSQHLVDIERMQRAATGVSKSLTQLLDLKQKHANAIEARFTRDQAENTARQGQTIMIFTIVTIVFLPMSFIAAFFAINIVEFPHNVSPASSGASGMHLGWVSKYVFGIGFSVSLPLIMLAFLIADSQGSKWQMLRWLKYIRPPNSNNYKQAPSTTPGTSGGGSRSSGIVQRRPSTYSSTLQADECLPRIEQTDGAHETISRGDSEGYLFPRRNTIRVGTGLTAETADSEV
ncbi:hypothetical protein DV736_g1772, partial [Chaetothyriales sp. CBS 134916]